MNDLVHNILKIRYADEGFLPFYPYHLISEEEMIDAGYEYMDYRYECPSDEFLEVFENMFKYRIPSIIERYRDEFYYDKYPVEEYGEKPDKLPDWLYSYLLGECIGPYSEQKDIHDLLVLMNLDNLYDEFDDEIYRSIVKICDEKRYGYNDEYLAWDKFWYSEYHPEDDQVPFQKPEKLIVGGEDFNIRPSALFGEPDVLRILRLEQVEV